MGLLPRAGRNFDVTDGFGSLSPRKFGPKKLRAGLSAALPESFSSSIMLHSMANEKPTSPESSTQPVQSGQPAEPAPAPSVPSAPPVAEKARRSGVPGWVTIGAVIFVLIAAAGLAFSYHIGLLTHNFRTIAP